MSKPRCTRGIQKHCPERTWNAHAGEGCNLWIERNVLDKAGQRTDIKQCIDLWMFKLAWDQCGLLEGNQQAQESTRNNLTVGLNNINNTLVRTALSQAETKLIGVETIEPEEG